MKKKRFNHKKAIIGVVGNLIGIVIAGILVILGTTYPVFGIPALIVIALSAMYVGNGLKE